MKNRSLEYHYWTARRTPFKSLPKLSSVYKNSRVNTHTRTHNEFEKKLSEHIPTYLRHITFCIERARNGCFVFVSVLLSLSLAHFFAIIHLFLQYGLNVKNFIKVESIINLIANRFRSKRVRVLRLVLAVFQFSEYEFSWISCWRWWQWRQWRCLYDIYTYNLNSIRYSGLSEWMRRFD